MTGVYWNHTNEGEVKMGCDIHFHSEVKVNGKWECYGSNDIKRSYLLFSKMAGVRGSENPISLPKGMPSDLSAISELDYNLWGADGHSHSWLDAGEIEELAHWMRETEKGSPHNYFRFEDIFGYLFGNTWGGFSKYPEDRPKGIEDVRFVFWFDN